MLCVCVRKQSISGVKLWPLTSVLLWIPDVNAIPLYLVALCLMNTIITVMHYSLDYFNLMRLSLHNPVNHPFLLVIQQCFEIRLLHFGTSVSPSWPSWEILVAKLGLCLICISFNSLMLCAFHKNCCSQASPLSISSPFPIYTSVCTVIQYSFVCTSILLGYESEPWWDPKIRYNKNIAHTIK